MNIKKLLNSILLTLFAVLIAFCGVSCDDSGAESQTTEPPAQREMMSLDGYTFVYPASASKELIAAVRDAVNTLSTTGIKLTHTNDWMAIAPTEPVRNDEKEILVGATNRAESLEVPNEAQSSFAFTVLQTGTKVVIYGGSEEALIRGVEHLVALLTADGGAIEKEYKVLESFVDEAVSADSVIARLASEYELVFPVLSNSGEKAIAEDIASTLLSKTLSRRKDATITARALIKKF